MDDSERQVFDYEASFILKDEEDASFLAAIFAKNKTEIINFGTLIKMNAAYQIKKQKLVFFGTTTFSSDPETLEKILGDLRLQPKILRFMVRRIKNKALRETRMPVVSREKRERKKPTLLKPASKNFEAVLTNEALQEKIDEILK